MLLLHQTGSVKIGETVRYTITYTPGHDRILPPPPHLHLRIKNTCAVALRAAFIHGPYTLYVSSSPSNFHPDRQFDTYRRDGIPEFEPQLKAGGSWYSRLLIPEDIRATAGSSARWSSSAAKGRKHSEEWASAEASPQPRKSVTWIVEVASQVLFSTSASVHYEILLGRDEKSLSLGLGSLAGNPNAPGVPGHVSDHQESQGARDGHHAANMKGVFSRAIRLRFDDTASLWNRPRLPEWDDEGRERGKEKNRDAPVESVTKGSEEESRQGQGRKKKQAGGEHAHEKQKKVHLVVLTHGLHSNLGADMLYIKESIDEAARQAKEDAKVRRAKRRQEEKEKASEKGRAHEEMHESERENEKGETKAPAEQRGDDTDEAEDDEEVIVRGFSGNAVRTEKGIKYLGKRLARWILTMTYPDQPFKPIHRSTSQSIAAAIKSDSNMHDHAGPAIHNHSDIHREPYKDKKLAYKITSISFVAHSLGGLIQTYAIAYIQKHSPHFFDTIKPVNFVAMATPFLGLSNENPVYIKMALDFGFVGRTGQDLGLTWRAPTLARSGWGAIVGGIGEKTHKDEQDANSKPLLRILPTGPAHIALKKFRNRTLYSNVVNDGVVPLRTSCLLFLDWQGLGRVEKARRENGLVGTVAQWGWAELTGANVTDNARRPWLEDDFGEDESGANSPTRHGMGSEVPQPSVDAMKEDDNQSLKNFPTSEQRPRSKQNDQRNDDTSVPASPTSQAATATTTGPLDSFLGLFRSSPKPHHHTPKNTKVYKRSQTLLRMETDKNSSKGSTSTDRSSASNNGAATSIPDDVEEMSAPPRTSIFESAGDIINPPLPPVSFLIDPSSRPRTIFHDRVYHPDDIPPPPVKRRSMSLLTRRLSRQGSTSLSMNLSSPISSPQGNHTTFPPPSPSTTTSNQPQPQHPHHQDSTTTSSIHSAPSGSGNHTLPSPPSLTSMSSPSMEIDTSSMKVEEKIARAYHKDLSWRKVLVRLEPDAHNNMMVRRRFANAYGWPVVKHLCDTHFSDSAVAWMRDEDEDSRERAWDVGDEDGGNGDVPPGHEGQEVRKGVKGKNSAGEHQEGDHDHDAPPAEDTPTSTTKPNQHKRTESEIREATDQVPPLQSAPLNSLHPGSLAEVLSGGRRSSSPSAAPSDQRPPLVPRPRTRDSDQWSEGDFVDSEGDEEDGDSDADADAVADGQGPGLGPGPQSPGGLAQSQAQVRARKARERQRQAQAQAQQDNKRPSATGWNWETAIAGRGRAAGGAGGGHGLGLGLGHGDVRQGSGSGGDGGGDVKKIAGVVSSPTSPLAIGLGAKPLSGGGSGSGSGQARNDDDCGVRGDGVVDGEG